MLFRAFSALLAIPIAVLAADSILIPPPLTVPLNCVIAESLALARDPILAEKELEVDKAREKLRDVDMGAILPKFDISTGMGPAPGIHNTPDTSSLHVFPNGSLNQPTFLPGSSVYQYQKEYDFGNWGPFFGFQAEVAQPLNIGRFRAGRRASERQIDISSSDFHKEKLEVSEQVQILYYQRLYALTMRGILDSARRDLDKAQKKLSDQLDQGAKGVAQTDLLQLKAGRFALDQGWNEALLGISRTAFGLRFVLAWPDSVEIQFADSVLATRSEAIPSLDSLKLFTLRDHPDLKRLKNGLAARQELLKVAQGELGPDIFLFGSFNYTKAWSSDRESGGNNPFARDPLNELTGLAGLGMKLNLNFWQRYQEYRKDRLELRQLERTEVYAARGLLLKVEDAYARLLKSRADVEEAQKALRASKAWLKGAAMKYDLDPSTSRDLISPFKQSLTAQRDYYQAVLDYNLSVAALFKAVGWTLPDYFRSLPSGGVKGGQGK
jgi:outer membrane protein TolC